MKQISAKMRTKCQSIVHWTVLLILSTSVQQVRTVSYFIGSECTGNEPCCTFHELNTTALSDQSSVVLVLLPGLHVLLQNFLLEAVNVSELVIHPWIEQEAVEIQCQSDSYLKFSDIGLLNISFVQFNSCSADWTDIGDANVSNCSFVQTVNSTDFYYQPFLTVSTVRLHLIRCQFTGNQAIMGGAITTHHSNLTIDLCIFKDNSAKEGGAIRSNFSSLLIRNCTFGNNCAEDNGGAIHASSDLILQINDVHSLLPVDYISEHEIDIFYSNFTSNCAKSGGAIYGHDLSMHIAYGKFSDNYAIAGGGAIAFVESQIRIYHISLHHNSAFDGGAIHFLHSKSSIVNDTTFTSNRARGNGGAMYGEGSGAFIVTPIIDVTFFQMCAKSNHAKKNGGFAYIKRGILYFSWQHVVITNNTASSGGAFYAYESQFNYLQTTSFLSGNMAENFGGALFLDKSTLAIIRAQITFTNNIVHSANGKGGAIFVNDINCDKNHLCFFHLDLGLQNYTAFVFSNNSASNGPAVYGGMLDRCLTANIEILRNVSHFENRLDVTSEPLKVCLCDDMSRPDCGSREVNFTKLRGEGLGVKLAALDQADNFVPSIIKASYNQSPSAHVPRAERKWVENTGQLYRFGVPHFRTRAHK